MIKTSLFKLIGLTTQQIVKEIQKVVGQMTVSDAPKLQKDPVAQLQNLYARLPFFLEYTAGGTKPRTSGKEAWTGMMEELDKVDTPAGMEMYVTYSWLGNAADTTKVQEHREALLEKARHEAKGGGKGAKAAKGGGGKGAKAAKGGGGKEAKGAKDKASS